MYLCDDDHEEIVYASHDCPLCAANKNIAELDGSVDDLKEQIKDLEGQIPAEG